MILWGRLNSHNVKKAVWALEEIGLPYERRDMGGAFGYTSEYLAMNPNRLVPTLVDGDLVLYESNAILRYLGARYGEALWPADPVERARADRWMDWQFSYADAQRDAFLQCVRVAPDQRDAAVIARSAQACGAMMAILEVELALQPYLTGESFGIADIAMGTYAHTYFTLDLARYDATSPDLPDVRDWYARLIARPAFASIAIPLS